MNGLASENKSASPRPVVQPAPATVAAPTAAGRTEADAPANRAADSIDDGAPDLETALQAAISAKPATAPGARGDIAPMPAISPLDVLAQGLAAAGVTAKRPVEPEPVQKTALPETAEVAQKVSAAAAPPKASAAPVPPKASAGPAAPKTSPAPEVPAKPEKEVSEPAAASSPKEVPAPSIAGPASNPLAGLRTLEDTVADLLRPMLREWLDANMPRIVEKALRVETIMSVKPQGSPKEPR
jgi:cell pole-organizing protein PopZ